MNCCLHKNIHREDIFSYKKYLAKVCRISLKMEGTKANIEKITRTKTINDNVDIGSINKDKDRVIEEFEQALNFLKGVEIKNEEDLLNIKKPFNDLKSHLKYFPNGPFFNNVVPTGIKLYILSYLCDSSAFVSASVCQEWKKILESRFKDEEVIIGDNCSECEDKDNQCVKPVDMFNPITHGGGS